MIRKTLFILMGLAAFTLGCEDGTGACVGQYGTNKYECKENWDPEECEDWDTQQVNGSGWTFHAGDSCSSLGYTNKCSDGTYVSGSCP